MPHASTTPIPTPDPWAALFFAAQAMEVEPDEARIVAWVRRRLCPLVNATYGAVAEREALRMRLSKVGKHVPSMIVDFVQTRGRTR